MKDVRSLVVRSRSLAVRRFLAWMQRRIASRISCSSSMRSGSGPGRLGSVRGGDGVLRSELL